MIDGYGSDQVNPKTLYIIKESDVLQAGCFLLELVELTADVGVMNVVYIASPEHRKGNNSGIVSNLHHKSWPLTPRGVRQ